MSDPSDFGTRKSGYEDTEYNVRYPLPIPGSETTDTHLDRINAAAAYARGATGDGETIVIYDTGFLKSHQEFAGTNKITETFPDTYRPRGQELFHGTAVAGVAAANRNGEGMHGVAFEAALSVVPVVVNTRLSPRAVLYTPVPLAKFDARNDGEIADTVGYPIRFVGGAILNYSFGYDGAISEYDAALVREKLSFTAATLAQAGMRDADKKIVVWAAGNAGAEIVDRDGDPETTDDQTRAVFDSPELVAGLGVVFTELQSHVLAVVALDQDGTIADYSNHCGLAKNFCLAAPGSAIVTPSHTGNTGYAVASGTSFAAPIVSGSLALLRHFFRNADGTYQLGNTELVTRLRFTANRQGIYADSDIYGSGLIDLDAATRPAGVMMTSVPWNPDARPVAGMRLELAGGAFGTRLSESLGAVEMVAFDQLGAPFPINLGQSLHPAARSGRLPRALRTRQALVPTASGAPARFELVSDASGHIDEAMISFASGRGAPAGFGRESGINPGVPGYGVEALRSFASGRAGLGRESGINPGVPGYGIKADKSTTDWWLSWGYHDGRALGLYRDGAAVSFLDSSAFAAPWLSLVQAGPGLGTLRALPAGGHLGFALMNGTPQHDGEAPADRDRGTGIILEYRPGARTPALQTGVVWEADGFLGSAPARRFRQRLGRYYLCRHQPPLVVEYYRASPGRLARAGGRLLRLDAPGGRRQRPATRRLVPAQQRLQRGNGAARVVAAGRLDRRAHLAATTHRIGRRRPAPAHRPHQIRRSPVPQPAGRPGSVRPPPASRSRLARRLRRRRDAPEPGAGPPRATGYPASDWVYRRGSVQAELLAGFVGRVTWNGSR